MAAEVCNISGTCLTCPRCVTTKDCGMSSLVMVIFIVQLRKSSSSKQWVHYVLNDTVYRLITSCIFIYPSHVIEKAMWVPPGMDGDVISVKIVDRVP